MKWIGEIWEGPQTEVSITRGFFMGKYEVTQGEYEEAMGNNPSWFNGVNPQGGSTDYGTDLNRPVEFLAWSQAIDFCAAVTEREQAARRIPAHTAYRLPTEAEWEYACRAWTSTRFSYGDDPNYSELTDYAWYSGNNEGTTHPVGQKLPNAWGLYDMHGNVWEYCYDSVGDYPGGRVLDPTGADWSMGRNPVIRGGSSPKRQKIPSSRLLKAILASQTSPFG
jgi:formylglycine-generating enzyme required for sulfatase activity